MNTALHLWHLAFQCYVYAEWPAHNTRLITRLTCASSGAPATVTTDSTAAGGRLFCTAWHVASRLLRLSTCLLRFLLVSVAGTADQPYALQVTNVDSRAASAGTVMLSYLLRATTTYSTRQLLHT